jgi:hypothetical protein
MYLYFYICFQFSILNEFFVVFLSVSRQMSIKYLEIDHSHWYPNYFKFS